MVEELGGQYTAAGRSHGEFSIELLILYCLGKQLTSKQASRGLPNQAIKQAKGCFACLSASLSSNEDIETFTGFVVRLLIVDLSQISLLLCLTTPLMSYKPVSITHSLRSHLMYI